MLSISFSLGSHIAYHVPSLSLTGTGHQLQVDFEDGEHVFTSPDFELGTIHSMKDTPLLGRIIFRYTHSLEEGIVNITVCDEDYESADGMTLMTFPKGREDASCFERSSSAGFAADEIHRNGYWNTRSPLLPGASQLFKTIARDAARAMIEALAAKDDIILSIRTPFPEMPYEEYQQLCLVYRDGEFLCTYDQLDPLEFKGNFEIWDVFSQLDGTAQLPLNATFANVIGSTGDQIPGGGSWVRLWSRETRRPANTCASFGFPTSVTRCVRGARLVGGHIILQRTAQRVRRGSNSVRIIPICSAHNHTSFVNAMEARAERWVVVLKNYHNP
ncbi:hypothetical protein BKA62DRAFT_705012 [Auriculariales sp. MPI-PUGE-AT-0066]|nr:hypothetical protein BKA62DRAFT_705012 [Auriculariales sp. MPI-PUGE-AT-0066]